ncbi:MAG: carbohydrate kinase [Verrucomicrobia bacterium]|nr:carbohydrate kinase [Verrucomicrobiota bacterium]NBS04181.1 carbohydrate kinase [Verrucomicrobiota bacterium]NBY36942.1 carbohydrate kinase [Verrucomicrobiota bacterium]
MAKVLGLDLSTQSATALVLDTTAGVTLARARAAFGADFPDRNHPEGFIRGGKGGEVHADPLLWLDGLELALQRLAVLTDLSKIDAISVSGQQHGSVYLAAGYEAALADANPATSLAAKFGSVLSRRTSPIWMDSSTEKECAEIAAALGGDQKVCDLTGSVATRRFTGPQIRRFAKENPTAWNRTKRVHLVSSFFASVLAGRDAAIDTGDGAGMNLMDIRLGDWAPAALVATAPNLIAKLPPVRPGSTVAGPVSGYLIARYGFSPLCQVVIGTGDNPSSLVGMGASLPGKVVVSLGTSDTLFAAIEGIRTDPAGLGHAFGNPMGGSMSLVCVRNGSLAREAIRRECGLADWATFSASIEASPAAMAAVLPMEEDEITPRRSAGRIALGVPTSLASLPRAAVEGQALSLRLHSRWVGTPTTQLLLTGGASENPAVAKIFADVFGAPVLRLAVSDSAALGAALRATVAACGAKMADLEKVFCAPAPGVVQPDPTLRGRYDLLEAELGQALVR